VTVPSVLVTGVTVTVPSVLATGVTTVPSVLVTGAVTVPSVLVTGAVTAPAAGVEVPRVGATGLALATVDVMGPVTAPAAGVAVPRVGSAGLAVATVDVTGPVTVPAAGVAVPWVGATGLAAVGVVTGPVTAGVAVPWVGATGLAVATVDAGVGGAAGVVGGAPTVSGVEELAVPLVGAAAAGGEGLDDVVTGVATPLLDDTTGLNVELATPPTPDGETADADVPIPRADALPELRSTTKATTAKTPNTRRTNAWNSRRRSVAPPSCFFACNRVFMDATGGRLFRDCPANRSFRPVHQCDNPAGPRPKPVLSARIWPGVTAIGVSPGTNGAMPAGSFRRVKGP
jgi:hypothetical protein